MQCDNISQSHDIKNQKVCSFMKTLNRFGFRPVNLLLSTSLYQSNCNCSPKSFELSSFGLPKRSSNSRFRFKPILSNGVTQYNVTYLLIRFA